MIDAALSGKRLLLTGGTGFFGRSLIRHWMTTGAERPDEIVVLSRDPEAFSQRHPELMRLKGLVMHRGNILEPGTLPRSQFDYLIHAAADSTPSADMTAWDRYTQIVDGTRNTLECAGRWQGKPRILLVSSGAVYGRGRSNEPQPFTEDDCTMPDPMVAHLTYGVAKRTSEHLATLSAQRFGLQIMVARCFAFVGEDLPLNAHYAIGNFIDQALKCDRILIKGNGLPVRSYMDQRDLARWLTVILTRGQPGQAYNVGSDRPITIGQLAKMTRDLLSSRSAVEIRGLDHINGAGDYYLPCIRKAQLSLGLRREFDLEESILRVAAFHRFQA